MTTVYQYRLTWHDMTPPETVEPPAGYGWEVHRFSAATFPAGNANAGGVFGDGGMHVAPIAAILWRRPHPDHDPAALRRRLDALMELHKTATRRNWPGWVDWFVERTDGERFDRIFEDIELARVAAAALANRFFATKEGVETLEKQFVESGLDSAQALNLVDIVVRLAEE